MKTRNFALLIPCAVLIACGRPEDPVVAAPPAPVTEAAPATATASMAGASGQQVQGELRLTASAAGLVPSDVAITGELTGLPPNSVHGFHVHQVGDCSAPDASSAGPHFNPTTADHGGPGTDVRHIGDLMNIEADETGKAVVNAIAMGATLGDGGAQDLSGKALVVHAKRDDYKTQPSGDSGDRISCGVIR